MNNRLIIKDKLTETIATVAKTKGINPQYPLTDTLAKNDEIEEIAYLTQQLESLNPFPQPLLYATSLLDGIWQLNYSTAREIRSLNKLPLGFKLKEVYQIIDTKNASFYNLALVKHSSNLFRGYVKVTATFSPDIGDNELVPKEKINVNFEKRYIAITNIIGLKTPILDPVKVVTARNPEGRIPSLRVTYIDNTMRIGRGGDGSLFVLSRSNQLKL